MNKSANDSPPKLTRETLRGVWCALLTPWNADDSLDETRFARDIRSYGPTGVHGVYTGGTTGEFYAQDDDTFERITKIACDEAHALALPVQIGCTALSTRVARRRIKTAVRAGADGIQIALPFWLELKDDEAMSFLRDVAAEAGAVPIILYQTMRAKRKLPPEFLGRVTEQVPTLIGAKDTGCDIAGLKEILKYSPGFSVFGGEGDMVEKISAGGRGAYCSVTGFNARAVVTLYERIISGDLNRAAPLQKSIHRLLYECLVPMNTGEEGLFDSAIDRIQREAGGGDVGLRCAAPYRSGTKDHVARVREWCRQNAPELLPAEF